MIRSLQTTEARIGIIVNTLPHKKHNYIWWFVGKHSLGKMLEEAKGKFFY